MPSYDYRCRTCAATFEVRRNLDDPETAVDCPQGHAETSRVFTAVAVGSGAGDAQPAGGCCGGGCCG